MIWIRFGNDIGVCAYVRKIWSQGRHFRCRDLNPKPLNVFLTPKRCSVLYFVKSVIYRTVGDISDSRWYIGQSVIYRTTCRYHGCSQLKSSIKYQTTRYNHLPWGTAVCTNVYLCRISGRTCGDHKRWTLCHYMRRSLFYKHTMAGRHTCIYL